MNDYKARDMTPGRIWYDGLELTDAEWLDPVLRNVCTMVVVYLDKYGYQPDPDRTRLIINFIGMFRQAREDSRRIDAMGLVYLQRAAPTLGIREVTFKMPCGTDPMTLLPLSFRKALDLVIKARTL